MLRINSKYSIFFFSNKIGLNLGQFNRQVMFHVGFKKKTVKERVRRKKNSLYFNTFYIIV